ncbi:MAG: TonB family protein [Nannocystaceae bacterium]|nr:TonB family protein [Nannocystaceae bacterium]
MANRSTPSTYVTRVVLALGRSVVHEASVTKAGSLTVGHGHGCDFVLPIAPAVARTALVAGGSLHLPAGFDGRLVLAGTEHDVASLRESGKTKVALSPEDWGVLWLRERPDLRLVVLQVTRESLPPMPGDGANRPLFASLALSAVAMGLLLGIAYLRYDPERHHLELEQLDERITRAMFNDPPRDPPPEEDTPITGDEDKPAEKPRKRAGGPEGTFGRPDKVGRSNIPKTDATTSTNATNVGLVKELNVLAQTDTMADLLSVGGQISGTDTGPLVVGAGTFGMSTRGSGQGGGGDGEGVIHGTANVDMGGSGTDARRRTVKGKSGPKEKQVSVQTGTARVKGQLSKELIDKEVRRHRAQIGFCYNKQLARQPDLSGKVSLQWIIRLDGSVTGAKVKSSSLNNGDAESCMVRALQNWRFPKPEGGVVEVEYPFVFDTE